MYCHDDSNIGKTFAFNFDSYIGVQTQHTKIQSIFRSLTSSTHQDLRAMDLRPTLLCPSAEGQGCALVRSTPGSRFSSSCTTWSRDSNGQSYSRKRKLLLTQCQSLKKVCPFASFLIKFSPFSLSIKTGLHPSLCR